MNNLLAHKEEVQVLGGLQYCLTSGLMMFSRTYSLHFDFFALQTTV